MADPLVLLPGMMCDGRVFGPQVEAFSGEIPVMTAPVTQGDRIEAIAENLLPSLPERFSLAGLGMGGVVAMEILSQAPERVRRLALISTSPLAESPDVAAGREALIVKARCGGLAEAIAETFPTDSLAPGPGREAVQVLILEMAMALGAEVFVRQSRALQRRGDQQAVLRGCHVPTLVICGGHDSAVPLKRQRFMAELIPGAKLKILQDAGIMPTIEAPAESVAMLREWLEMPFVLR